MKFEVSVLGVAVFTDVVVHKFDDMGVVQLLQDFDFAAELLLQAFVLGKGGRGVLLGLNLFF